MRVCRGGNRRDAQGGHPDDQSYAHEHGVTTTRVVTTSRLLISVDWLHRCKLPLDVPDGGLCCLYGSSFAGSLTDTYNASAAIPHDAADISEVEADQPVDHQQIRDGADGKAGPLLSVALIASAGFPCLLTCVGAEMTESLFVDVRR